MEPAIDLSELERAAGTEGLLKATCKVLTGATDADACMISRVLGVLLIEVAQWWKSGTSLHLGHGYLLTDYPLTANVLDRGEPQTVSLFDPEPDASEAGVLKELGFDSVLMLPLVVGGASWALVEVYLSGRAFSESDIGVARPVAQRAGELLATRLG
jgi:GAF domain-containing protein